MSKNQFPALGESLKRSIRITLVILDEMLCDFEEIARGRARRSLLFTEHNPLSDGQRGAILEKTGQMRVLMQELMTALALEAETHDLSREIFGRGSAFWAHLVDTESKGLTRYGETPEGFAEYIDPRIEALIRDLDSITRIAHRQTDDGRPSS